MAALVAVLTPVPVFRIHDPRIGEASGIAPGIASPGVVYVHNDSGDSARFFALDARSGTTLATYTVPGATNVDWEDIAVARDRRGVPSVWIADTGDNQAQRPEVRLYRVDEPHVRAGVDEPTGRPDVWRLRYPDGPIDAEALAVAPGGAAYLVTKALLGGSSVYAVPPRPAAGVQTLRPVGRIQFHFTGTSGGPNRIGQLTATGASMTASVLAVRTYTDAYLWRLSGGDLAAALRHDPVRVPLPAQPQGEGIALDGSRLLIDSEGGDGAVYAVPLPRLPAPRSLAPRPSGTSPAAPATPSRATAPTARHSDGPRYALIGGIGALVLAIGVVALARTRGVRR